MATKNVKSSLNDISKSLHSVNAAREYLIKNTRDVVILCSHSIIAAHKGDLRLAKQKIKNAELVLKKNQKKAKDDFKKYLITPEQEFVEAHSFLAIESHTIPPPTSADHHSLSFSQLRSSARRLLPGREA